MPHIFLAYIFRNFLSLFITLLLVSCASTQQSLTDQVVPEPERYTNYKYPAWRLVDDQHFHAINSLLDESDRLIADNELEAAADKLERALRINPRYAPAWSRLSWVALQSDNPARSMQMAKRSNSFAQFDTELRLLNWTFIRSASQRLNDEKTYQQADEQINSLKSM